MAEAYFSGKNVISVSDSDSDSAAIARANYAKDFYTENKPFHHLPSSKFERAFNPLKKAKVTNDAKLLAPCTMVIEGGARNHTSTPDSPSSSPSTSPLRPSSRKRSRDSTDDEAKLELIKRLKAFKSPKKQQAEVVYTHRLGETNIFVRLLSSKGIYEFVYSFLY